jgi:hypothetical protein
MYTIHSIKTVFPESIFVNKKKRVDKALTLCTWCICGLCKAKKKPPVLMDGFLEFI